MCATHPKHAHSQRTKTELNSFTSACTWTDSHNYVKMPVLVSILVNIVDVNSREINSTV